MHIQRVVMGSRRPFLDKRLGHGCAYCGGPEETKDHVPSKAFLDDPLPTNLPVVNACRQCNEGFSLDEEYLAAFLECVLAGTTDPHLLKRDKVRETLKRKPLLRSLLDASRRKIVGGQVHWHPKEARVHNVILKLARGHAAYELSEHRLGQPSAILALPLTLLAPQARKDFERAGASEVRPWPEIGTCAFSRAMGEPPFQIGQGPWVVVQHGRYRYSVDFHGDVTVRLVLSEYLAGEVTWAS